MSNTCAAGSLVAGQRHALYEAGAPSESRQVDLLAVVGSIYQATIEEELWSDALAMIRDACLCSEATIHLCPMPGASPIVIGPAGSKGSLEEPNPGADAAHDDLPVDLDGLDVLKRATASVAGATEPTPWSTTQLAFKNCSIIELDVDGVAAAALVVQHGADRHALSSHAVHVLERLKPHIERALKMTVANGHRLFQLAELYRETNCLPFGRLLVDGSASVCHMNRAASRILDARDGLAMDENFLVAIRASDNRKLREQIRYCATANTAQSRALISIERRSVDHCYAVRISAYRSAAASRLTGRVPAVEVLISNAEHDLADIAVVAACRHGFSKAERKILERLVQGETIEQTAESLGLALGTVRLHVAHMMKKSGAHRQADLIRRVLAPFVVSPHGLGIIAAG